MLHPTDKTKAKIDAKRKQYAENDDDEQPSILYPGSNKRASHLDL
jgi:hypothetical protein